MTRNGEDSTPAINDSPVGDDYSWTCGRCGAANEALVEFCSQCGGDSRAVTRMTQRPAGPPPRSSAETRARILEMFKRGNRKYALPFDQDRLAMASILGGDWEEYGQIVLQMAILDTLLSIEELLSTDHGTTA